MKRQGEGHETEDGHADGPMQTISAGVCDRLSNRRQRKQAARLWARGSFGVELAQDAADAAGIACWVARLVLLASRGIVARDRS